MEIERNKYSLSIATNIPTAVRIAKQTYALFQYERNSHRVTKTIMSV